MWEKTHGQEIKTRDCYYNMAREIFFSCPWVFSHVITMSHNLFPLFHSDLVYSIISLLFGIIFFGTWLAGTLPRVRSRTSTWQSISRVRSDDSSGPRKVCHARHIELPDALAGRCHSSSAQVQCKRPTPPTMSPCPTQAYQQQLPTHAFTPKMYARTKVIFSWILSK